MGYLNYGNGGNVQDQYVTVPVEYIYKGNNKVWERNVPVTPCSYDDWWYGYESGLLNGNFTSFNNYANFVNFNVPFNGNLNDSTFNGEMSNYLPQTVPNLYVMQLNNFLCYYPGNRLDFPYPFGQRCNVNDQTNIGNKVNNCWSIKNFQLPNGQAGECFNNHKFNSIYNCWFPGYIIWQRQVDGYNVNINIDNSKFWRFCLFYVQINNKTVTATNSFFNQFNCEKRIFVNAYDCDIWYSYHKQFSEINYVNCTGRHVQILSDSNGNFENCYFNEYMHSDTGRINIYNSLFKGQINAYSYSNMNVFNSYSNTYIAYHTYQNGNIEGQIANAEIYSYQNSNLNANNITTNYFWCQQYSQANVENGRINYHVKAEAYANLNFNFEPNAPLMNNSMWSTSFSDLHVENAVINKEFFATGNGYITANNCIANRVYSQTLSYFTLKNSTMNWAEAFTTNTVLNLSDCVVKVWCNATESGNLRATNVVGNAMFCNASNVSNPATIPAVYLNNCTFENYTMLPTTMYINQFVDMHAQPFNELNDCNIQINGRLYGTENWFNFSGTNIYRFHMPVTQSDKYKFVSTTINFALCPYNNNTTRFPLINFNSWFQSCLNLQTANISLSGDENFNYWFNGTHATTGIWAVQMFYDCRNLTGNGAQIMLAMGYVGDPYAPDNQVMNSRFSRIFFNCQKLEDYNELPAVYK